MTRFSLLLIISVFFFHFSIAQHALVKQWDHRYGGTGNDKLAVFQQTDDGGFVLGGISSSGIGGDKTQSSWANSPDYWIIKIDFAGNKQWDKRFGGPGKEELKSLQQTRDGGFVLGGYSNSGVSGDKTEANWDQAITNPSNDYWIVKTDALGNKQWDKRFGGIYDDKLSSVRQTNDGGYILAGYSASGISGDKTEASRGSADYWIVKIDSLGNKEWDKRFGGANNDQLYSICCASDGGYLLGGFSWSQISGDKTQLNCGASTFCDFWIVKVDRSGNKQWDRRIGGADNDELYCSESTVDGGYILAGYSWSGISGDKTQGNWGPSFTSDYWIVKIDSTGNIQWDKDFGGVEREDELGNISLAKDGGYLFGSTSYSGISGNKSENNLGIEQTWIIKTDALGNKQWDKTIFTTGHDEAGLVIQTRDGSYAMANYTNGDTGGYKTQPNRDSSLLTYDYWIVKFRDTTSRPVVNYTTSDQTICAGTCINFINLSQGYDSYRWFFPGALPLVETHADPQHICYDSAGKYEVILVAINNHGSDTMSLPDYIRVFPSPPPFAIHENYRALFVPQGFAAYQWYYQNQFINGANDYFYVPLQHGNYQVSVTDSNGCRAEAEIANVKVGINEVQGNPMQCELYPNPATNLLYVFVVLPSSVEGSDLIIYDLLGEPLIEKKSEEGRTTIDIKNLSPGVYFVEAHHKEKRLIRKFIKQ